MNKKNINFFQIADLNLQIKKIIKKISKPYTKMDKNYKV